MKKLLVILVSVIMVVSAVCLPMTLSASHEGSEGVETVYRFELNGLYQMSRTAWAWCDESPYGAYVIMNHRETLYTTFHFFDSATSTRDDGETAYAPVFSRFDVDEYYLWGHYDTTGSYWCHC